MNTRLTVNLGLRWEHFQFYQDVGGYEASFSPTAGSVQSLTRLTSTPAVRKPASVSGKAQYLIPSEAYQYALTVMNSSAYNPNYSTVLAEDNITPVSTSDPHLLKPQNTNFAPRYLALAWSPDAKTALRGGFGIFYGGLESTGYWPNLGENYPFQFTGTFNPAACGPNSCPTDGITIGNGFSSIIAAGFASNTTGLTMRGAEINQKTPYTEGWNLSAERGLSNDMVATLGYVGNVGRHLIALIDANSPLAAAAPGQGDQHQRPFPDAGGASNQVNAGESAYNALQAKIEKRMSHGYNLLATYTWGPLHRRRRHAPRLQWRCGQHRLLPGSAPVRPLPVAVGHTPPSDVQRPLSTALRSGARAMLNHNGFADVIVGGWSANAMFTAQSGNYFTVYTNSISTPANLSSARSSNRESLRRRRFRRPGNNASISCPSSVKNPTHWYNPCAFENPWNAAASGDHPLLAGKFVTDWPSIEGYIGGRRNQIAGPGFERVNMSIFKSFALYHEHSLDFRTDVFNLFNTPALANPSNTNIGSNGGLITSTRSLQLHAPDSSASSSFRFGTHSD